MQTLSKNIFLSFSILLCAGLLILGLFSSVHAAEPLVLGYCAVNNNKQERCELTAQTTCEGIFFPRENEGALEACKARDAKFTEPPPMVSPPSPGGFVPLTKLPGLTDDVGKRTLADYLKVLFRLAIGIGALLAVIKITAAGIKYMAHDSSFSSKEEAKKDITSALLGLLIMLSTVVILTLIYPGILNLNVLKELKPVEVIPSTTTPPTTTPGLLARCPIDGFTGTPAACITHCGPLGGSCTVTTPPPGLLARCPIDGFTGTPAACITHCGPLGGSCTVTTL